MSYLKKELIKNIDNEIEDMGINDNICFKKPIFSYKSISCRMRNMVWCSSKKGHFSLSTLDGISLNKILKILKRKDFNIKVWKPADLSYYEYSYDEYIKMSTNSFSNSRTRKLNELGLYSRYPNCCAFLVNEIFKQNSGYDYSFYKKNSMIVAEYKVLQGQWPSVMVKSIPLSDINGYVIEGDITFNYDLNNPNDPLGATEMYLKTKYNLESKCLMN